MVSGPRGVLISGCSDIQINNCTFGGLEVALDVRDSKNVTVKRSNFVNVGNAAVVRRAEGFVAEDNRAFSHGEPKLTTIARLVQIIVRSGNV